MKYKKLKFKIDPNNKGEDVLEKFPELKRHKVIAKSRYPNLNYVLRYIIFLYDPETDLIKDIPDLPNRKRAAAILAGFDLETPELNRLMEFKEPKLVDLIHCFLTEVYMNREYREWCTLHQELDEATRLRLKALGDDTKDGEDEVDLFRALELKGKVRKQTEDIHAKLDILEKKLFGGDTDLQQIAYVSRFTSPEAWTRRQEQVEMSL